jgi:mono/diheme cytochrome c family protein
MAIKMGNGDTMTAKQKYLIMAGAALALVGAMGGYIVAETTVPAHQDAERVAKGADLYTQNCASCHGARLEGQPNWRSPDSDGYMPAPPHDASGHTWHHPITQLFAVTKFGTAALVGNGYQSRMEGFDDELSDDQILDILAYIKSTWPADVQARHDQIDAASGG